MHYIRFLKSPAVSSHANATAVKALITVTTDLGDAFFAEDIDLQVNCLVSGDWADAVVPGPLLRWQAGMRSIPLEIANIDFQDEFELSIEAVGDKSIDLAAAVLHDGEGDISLPVIIPASSRIIDPKAENPTAGKLVRRDILMLENHLLSIWEDSGESIARHVWDAGMALVACLDAACHGTASGLLLLDGLLARAIDSGLNVLELGSGCGLAGLALATMLPRVRALLTDLEDARELSTLNISESSLREDSEAKFVPLDWDELLPETLELQALDLVLVADCTYNPESSPALVRTIASLATASSRSALIVVAMKKRHPSEDIFFQLMEEAGLVVREHIAVKASCGFADEDTVETQMIDIFAYTLNGKAG